MTSGLLKQKSFMVSKQGLAQAWVCATSLFVGWG